MQLILLLIFSGIACGNEYLGVSLGKLENSDYELSADVWVINKTMLQITNFHMPSSVFKRASFFFSDGKESAQPKRIYQLNTIQSEQYITEKIKDENISERLLLLIPKSYSNWKYFGLTIDNPKQYAASIKLDEQPPEPYCCLSDSEATSGGLKEITYGTQSAPIVLIDTKTIRIPKFVFKGTHPPDAWFFVGKGKLDKETGKRAFVIGRDTKNHHCPLNEDYTGNTDITILLPEKLTVYDINYISVFCYEYSVDFGHILFNISPNDIKIPPYLPPLNNHLITGDKPIPC